MALAGAAALLCAAANGQEAPDYVPQEEPLLLVCEKGETGDAVPKTLTVATDGDWSIKGANEGAAGAGDWIPAFVADGADEVPAAWGSIEGASWITPGSRNALPSISTTADYLFARAVRIGKLAEGGAVQAAPGTARYLVDNKIDGVWVTTDGAGASVDARLTGAGFSDSYSAAGGVAMTDARINAFNALLDWEAGAEPGEAQDNWLIFQVKNFEPAHKIGAHMGMAFRTELTATLDCTCPGDKEQDGAGGCVCPEGQEDIGEGRCADPCAGGAQRQEDGTCACPAGQELQGGVCAPIQCPVGQELQGDACTPIQCPTGQGLQGNECVPIVCPAGQQLQGSECVALPPAPDDGNNGGGHNPPPPRVGGLLIGLLGLVWGLLRGVVLWLLL